MSQNPHKAGQKMCKSPKNNNFKHEKIEYEHLSTNCTVVGSNNLNLVKKPQIITNMSPVYSNPSPSYPQSPYSSPASLKSPSPSLKPPTPQPNFPVMQLINNPMLTRQIQTSQQPQNIIKLKPHLNILPKPAASPQPSPKPSVSPIVIPNHQPAATIMPTAQPLLLNQMPMLTTPGVQFILRPQTAATAKLQPATAQMQTAAPQGLILQQGGQQLLHIQPPRSQPMVRVLTNGMHLAPGTSTYVTTQQPAANAAHITQQQINVNNVHHHQHQTKRKPKHKPKKKLDLANIMKLSGIGDDDDIQFESDASQSESEPNSVPGTPQPQNLVQTSTVQTHTSDKKIGNIQISAMPQPTINATATPVVQVLNQNFQSGMISNSTSQAAAQASIPFNSFIAPNFTINNGLMLQRSGGFKLTMGEDGRLVLQHDPQLQTQDLQSQLILQSLLALNGGLVLQPSMDQQTVQQTVQTIQQQSVQTIQQQTVQSQTIQTVQQQTVQPQTVQHALQTLQPQIQQQTVQQTIQHQTVQSQPLAALQQPMQIVQQQPIHSIHSQVQPAVHSIQSQVHSLQSQIQGQLQSLLHQQNQHQLQQQQQQCPIQMQSPMHTLQSPVHPAASPVSSHGFQQQQQQQVLKMQSNRTTQQHQPSDSTHNATPPTSYVVNLTPDQLEQLKRNGQLTVNGQTIFMQRPGKDNEKKQSPKTKPLKKANKTTTPHAVKNFLNDHHHAANDKNSLITSEKDVKPSGAIIQSLKQHNHVLPMPNKPPVTIATTAPVTQTNVAAAPVTAAPLKQQLQPKMEQKISPATTQKAVSQKIHDSNGAHQDVEKLLGQILEESTNNLSDTKPVVNNVPSQPAQATPPPAQQRITTIQLTPQKQQHLKSIQVQIQTLTARMQPGDTEMQNALKLLFNEQQKILASGKLLPPEKVYYHNNQLTIVNTPPLSMSSPSQIKTEPDSPTPPVTTAVPVHTSSAAVVSAATAADSPKTSISAPAIVTTQSHPVPRISISVPTSEISTQTSSVIHNLNHVAPHIHHPHQQHPNNSSNIAVNQRLTAPPIPVPTTSATSHPPQIQQQQQPPYHSLAKKAHLIEQQLTIDQNGATKPDVHTPFRDKKDACVRLVRYHCMDQPVLSEKDLDKADEIFELTAEHFMGKYSKMVDKYKYLLMRESMRQVQTSELMMLDRMFLAEEQQSLMRLRQDYENQLLEVPVPDPEPPPNATAATTTAAPTAPQVNPPQVPKQQQPQSDSEVYDEWACIQKELGCLQMPEQKPPPPPAPSQNQQQKRSSSSDSRLETLKRFRVEKNKHKLDMVTNSGSSSTVVTGASGYAQLCRGGGGIEHHQQQQYSNTSGSYSSQDGDAEQENNSIDEQVQSAIDSILNLQQSSAAAAASGSGTGPPLDLDSILS